MAGLMSPRFMADTTHDLTSCRKCQWDTQMAMSILERERLDADELYFAGTDADGTYHEVVVYRGTVTPPPLVRRWWWTGENWEMYP